MTGTHHFSSTSCQTAHKHRLWSKQAFFLQHSPFRAEKKDKRSLSSYLPPSYLSDFWMQMLLSSYTSFILKLHAEVPKTTWQSRAVLPHIINLGKKPWTSVRHHTSLNIQLHYILFNDVMSLRSWFSTVAMIKSKYHVESSMEQEMWVAMLNPASSRSHCK